MDSGPSKTQIDYLMGIKKDKKSVDVKAMAEEEVSKQSEIVICGVKEVKKPLELKKEGLKITWRSNKFENEFQRLAQVSGQKTAI